jgi:protein-S-isoprenylcysteine O-methyltransferase Ste14
MGNRLMPTTYLLVAILLSVGFHFLIPIIYFIRSPWNLIGILPIVFGIWINLSADQAFKKADTTVKPFETSSELIQEGVFRISRNPMYLGFEAILIGVTILLRSLSPFLIVILFPILMELVFIQPEERMLREEFGDQWERYRLRVRKWI